MTPLKPTTVFVPVSVDDELPKERYLDFFTINNNQYKRVGRLHSDNKFNPATSHWLKEQQGYFLTKEELTAILGDAFGAGMVRQEWDAEEYPSSPYEMDKEDYINSLIQA